MREVKKVRGVHERPLSSGIWWICYFDASGKRRREKVGTRGDALKLYKKRKTEALQGKKLPENLRGISDLAPALPRDYRVNGQESYDTAERRLRKHLLPFFGTVAANEPGSDQIERYTDNRLEEGAKNATINRELAVLKRIYNLARKCDPPKVDRVPKFPHLKESDPRQGFVEDEQYNLLVQHASELWLRAILAVAYSFGFRRAELLQHLEVAQVDLLNRSIRLHAGTTKNRKGRVVKMTSDVETLLGACVEGKKAHDYVFTRDDGRPIRNFRGAWDALCEKAGLSDLLFHDLRRSAVRNMVRRGISQSVAMQISGHKTPSVFERYNIVSESDLEDAAAKIEQGRTQNIGPSATISATSESGELEQEIENRAKPITFQ